MDLCTSCSSPTDFAIEPQADETRSPPPQASSARPTRLAPLKTSVNELSVQLCLSLTLFVGTVAWGVCNVSPLSLLEANGLWLTVKRCTLSTARLPLPLHQPMAQDASRLPSG